MALERNSWKDIHTLVQNRTHSFEYALENTLISDTGTLLKIKEGCA